MRVINLADPAFTYEPDEPDGYHAGCFRWGADVGAKRTGTSLYLLPPGESISPFHFEVVEEEWILVLAGHPTLRSADGEVRLDPWDSVFCPPGPEGAHKLTNHTEEPVRVLMYSNITPTSICVYPDSDKVGVFVEGHPEASGNYRRGSKVSYYDGEA